MNDYVVGQVKNKVAQILERLDESDCMDGLDDIYCDVVDIYSILDGCEEQDDIVEHNFDKEEWMKDQLTLNDYEFFGEDVLCPDYEESDEELLEYVEYLSRCGYQFGNN